MEIETTDIPGVVVARLRRIEDHRGFFSETFSRRDFAGAGIATDFVQDNLSLSASPGTVRGLHFQNPPHAQAKLVSVVTGRVLDVVVDIRTGSPTFGRHIAIPLAADDAAALYVPEGMAHGYLTLEPDTRIAYKVSDYYAPACDAGIVWNDPDLDIDWQISPETAIVSDRDRGHPRLTAIASPFIFAGEDRR